LLVASSPPGPWDQGQAYLTRTEARNRALYIRRSRTQEDRYGAGGTKIWRHDLEIYATWSFESAIGKLEDEQQAFDTAVAKLLTRIRGPLGDKSHDGAFVGVGEGDTGRDLIDVVFTDPRDTMGKRQPLTARILYPAYDEFVA
jgi:hypothetical protein